MCKSFLLEEKNSKAEAANDSIILKIRRKRRKLAENVEFCVDTSLVLGSIPAAMSFWSLSDAVIQENRKACSQMLFEEIGFLKTIQSYWNLSAICETISRRKSKKIIHLLGLEETEENTFDFN